MKKLIILILGMLLIGTAAFSQQKVDSFEEAMMARPSDKKTHFIDIIYADKGHSDSIKERSIRFKKPSQRSREFYKKIGKPIDEANLIDYKDDTLYMSITSSRQVVGGGSTTIKTKKGIFEMVGAEDDTYAIRPLEESYEIYLPYFKPNDIECFKKSDNLIYSAIFNWDLELLKQLISIAGGGYLDGNVMFVTRIIIHDNKVLQRDETSEIDVPVYWRLDNSDEGYCY